MYQTVKTNDRVIVFKQFQKFENVKNVTPFKNTVFFYFMLIHHLKMVRKHELVHNRDKNIFHAFKLCQPDGTSVLLTFLQRS